MRFVCRKKAKNVEIVNGKIMICKVCNKSRDIPSPAPTMGELAALIEGFQEEHRHCRKN